MQYQLIPLKTLWITQIECRLGARIYQPYAEIGVHPPNESIPMSQNSLRDFLMGPWTARLACVRSDGAPHVVPVWYAWEKGAFIIVAWPNSVWASLVKANPTVALSIDEPWPPMRRVMIRGEALYIPHDDIAGGINHLRHRIGARYLGAEQILPADNNPNSPTWSAFRITPHECIALQEKPAEG